MRSKDVLVGRAAHDLRQQRRGKRILGQRRSTRMGACA